MPPSDEVARRLVQYDERLAEDVLALICAQLGGPVTEGKWDPGQMRDFMADPAAARLRSLSELSEVDETTTAEWKSQFARSERLRTLGLALADLVAPKIGR
jgi:hypothetical protein